MSSSVFLLLLSLIGLASGPVLVSLWPQGQAWRALLTGLSLVLVGGLGLLVLLPHAIEHSGLLAVVIGVLAVAVLGWVQRRQDASLGRSVLLLVFLFTHAALDGAALAVADANVGGLLGLAVTAHRLPVGLALFLGASTPGAGWRLIGLLAGATLLGFFGSAPLVAATPPWVSGVLEALVIGALLHIATHSHAPPAGSPERRWSALGGLLGGTLVVLLAGLSWDWTGCS